MTSQNLELTDIVISWQLEDILNENLYQDQIKEIPGFFESVQQYYESFLYPLQEETRAQLCSTMETISTCPFATVISFEEYEPGFYDCKVMQWMNRLGRSGQAPYTVKTGDLFILSDIKPELPSDLQRTGKSWAFSLVHKISGDEDDPSTSFRLKTSLKDLEMIKKPMYAVFLFNMLPNQRIWDALHRVGDSEILQEVLWPSSNSMEIEDGDMYGADFLSSLNLSQVKAVLSCLHKASYEQNSTVELICGPPGTGKTKTVSVLLKNLMQNEFKTITVAPTNVAIVEVASRFLNLVKEMREIEYGPHFYSLSDVLLFGSKDRLKVGSNVEEIYLDYRVQKFVWCFGPLTGWKLYFASMIDLLEDCVPQYTIYLENERNRYLSDNSDKVAWKSFHEFVRERFMSVASQLKACLSIFCTHLPRKCILEEHSQGIALLIESLDSFESLFHGKSEVLEEHFTCPVVDEDLPTTSIDFTSLFNRRSECLYVLKSLQCSFAKLNLPSVTNRESIESFFFQNASIVFSTASSSYRLRSMSIIEPFKILVIDAAQMKECESLIALQLPHIKHAILVGDECQLPAMVESKLADGAGFGRSLFERLTSLGYPRHLLNVQYRMHPAISFFPNSRFYSGQIVDGPNVQSTNYQKNYLLGSMFGPYSFINMEYGREEKDDNRRSRRNMVEAAVALKIVQSLYKAWTTSKENISIGVMSPYSAQVAIIQDKIGNKYNNLDGFTVKVKSVDSFQGGEEDVIIISTVRSKKGSSIGFLCSDQRTNVALTRARYCLWILGNEKTLSNSESCWAHLVYDAKKRGCFFDADEDDNLAKAILEVKKEADQLEDLMKEDSFVFRHSRWKVLFSDTFLNTFKKLSKSKTKRKVLDLLVKLSSGWRPKTKGVNLVCGNSTRILKKFKVDGLYVICAIDIVEESTYMQVLRILDVLPLEDISKLIKRLDSTFSSYTDEYINLCQEICNEGNSFEVPKTWAISLELVRYKS